MMVFVLHKVQRDIERFLVLDESSTLAGTVHGKEAEGIGVYIMCINKKNTDITKQA